MTLTHRLSLGALSALTAMLVLTVSEVTGPVVAATPPCAPTPGAAPSTTPRPAAPTDLRILRDALVSGALFVPPDDEVASGPFAGAEPIAAMADSTAHSYFDALSLRADCLMAYSLRDAAQLYEYSESKSRPQAITYDPALDTDPRKQDAAKVVVPAGKVNLPNQVRVPIPAVGSSTLLVTWDAWWGREFKWANTEIFTYKQFQFASPGGRIFHEVRTDFRRAHNHKPEAIGFIDMRSYGQVGVELGSNVTENLPLQPQVGTFAIMPETWTRYWAYFKPAGEWHEFSLWVADETQAPVLLFDRLLIKPNFKLGATGWDQFWFEYNTSTSVFPIRGDLVGYVRNVVMLRGAPDVASLLQRPLR